MDFVFGWDPDRPEAELQPTTVEKDRLLVLGDHRSEAYDSRYWGTLHRSDLLGRVVLILFSRNPVTREVRWSRIGRYVE
jgi:signal peptidase I